MTRDNSKSSLGGPPFIAMGQGLPEATAALQKELLESYGRIGRAWLDRVQSEVTLWSDVSRRLSSTSSPSEAVETYTKLVSQRMQMAAEDAQRLFNESQEIMQKIGRALSMGCLKEARKRPKFVGHEETDA